MGTLLINITNSSFASSTFVVDKEQGNEITRQECLLDSGISYLKTVFNTISLVHLSPDALSTNKLSLRNLKS